MKIWKQIILVVLVLLAAFAGWKYFYSGAPGSETAGVRQSGGRGGALGPTLVVAKPVEEETINTRLSAIGTGRAMETVSVTPWSGGMMTKLLVKAGAHVKEGQPIAELDAAEEQIAHDKAEIALQNAQNTLRRITTLRSTNTATEVQVVDAQLAVANAKLVAEEAALALSRRTITAPISGVIGILPVNAGNFVTTTTAIATIDDRSQILIDIWVPERYAPQIRIGQPVTATSIAVPGRAFEGKIVAIDNAIDEASRTLRVRAQIPNPDDTLRAGMSFEVTLLFPGETYPSVDPLALQWGADGAFVWRIIDGVAHKVAIEIIQRNTTSILVNAPLKPGDMIVTQGVQTVRDGGPVKVADDGGAQAQPAASPNAG
ncbi:hemolysin secretion protein D [Brucella endophytica]|uniref:Hemolysin secretion protein D n=1 Tax=Brucella endophytica TaxID=1963359 RepID=A0A916WA17_9HYPH|nr:efflux RND transporter periplasmic adaptor subunit [Brucella endophytica]GGA79289.1 hemolysin secretion protein D [Brucella endophytica]